MKKRHDVSEKITSGPPSVRPGAPRGAEKMILALRATEAACARDRGAPARLQWDRKDREADKFYYVKNNKSRIPVSTAHWTILCPTLSPGNGTVIMMLNWR